MSWAAGIPIVGSVVSGYGQMKANQENKATKERLRWQMENLDQLAGPTGEALQGGYAPGGWLRAAEAAMLRQPVETGLGQQRGLERANAWRFGGSGSGLPGARWQDAAMQGALGMAEADQMADLRGNEMLGQLDARRRGYDFQPATVAGNRYAWAGDAISGFGQGYGQAGAGRF